MPRAVDDAVLVRFIDKKLHSQIDGDGRWRSEREMRALHRERSERRAAENALSDAARAEPELAESAVAREHGVAALRRGFATLDARRRLLRSSNAFKRVALKRTAAAAAAAATPTAPPPAATPGSSPRGAASERLDASTRG